MSRISTCLSELKQAGRKALIPYLVAGDPNKSFTVPVMHSMVAHGADIIELGVPFSDPMAEGPVIQRAHERALAHSTSLRDALSMVEEFRVQNQTTPVILMGYTNPIEALGYLQFCERAVEVGLDGVLTVDLPPEEASEFNQMLREHQLDNIFLVSPTSTLERTKSIASMASGFLYYVSLKGVTGAGTLNVEEVGNKVTELKSLSDVPVCVGFGIKDAASARQLASVADGVVVGSVLVNMLGQGDAGLISAEHLLKEMRTAINTL